MSKQKSDHDWQEYHEPLARIYREVKKALPELTKNAEHYFAGFTMPVESVRNRVIRKILDDPEIRPEIENLLSKMITEHEPKMIDNPNSITSEQIDEMGEYYGE